MVVWITNVVKMTISVADISVADISAELIISTPLVIVLAFLILSLVNYNGSLVSGKLTLEHQLEK